MFPPLLVSGVIVIGDAEGCDSSSSSSPRAAVLAERKDRVIGSSANSSVVHACGDGTSSITDCAVVLVVGAIKEGRRLAPYSTPTRPVASELMLIVHLVLLRQSSLLVCSWGLIGMDSCSLALLFFFLLLLRRGELGRRWCPDNVNSNVIDKRGVVVGGGAFVFVRFDGE